jgi:hypothetical protein
MLAILQAKDLASWFIQRFNCRRGAWYIDSRYYRQMELRERLRWLAEQYGLLLWWIAAGKGTYKYRFQCKASVEWNTRLNIGFEDVPPSSTKAHTSKSSKSDNSTASTTSHARSCSHHSTTMSFKHGFPNPLIRITMSYLNSTVASSIRESSTQHRNDPAIRSFNMSSKCSHVLQ